MWPLRAFALIYLGVSAGLIAAEHPDSGKPFGLSRRIPWTDSKVVGSPDPLPPYKAVRAFPGLTVKQPLGLFPEPGTNRLFILQHLNSWAGPGRLLAVPDDQKATAADAEMLLEIDGLAVGLAFHPDYRAQRLHLLRPERARSRARERWTRSFATRSAASRQAGSTRPRKSSSSPGRPTATTAAIWPSETMDTYTSPRVTAPAAPTPT